MHHIPICTDFMFPTIHISVYVMCTVYMNIIMDYIFILRICKLWSHQFTVRSDHFFLSHSHEKVHKCWQPEFRNFKCPLIFRRKYAIQKNLVSISDPKEHIFTNDCFTLFVYSLMFMISFNFIRKLKIYSLQITVYMKCPNFTGKCPRTRLSHVC